MHQNASIYASSPDTSHGGEGDPSPDPPFKCPPLHPDPGYASELN